MVQNQTRRIAIVGASVRAAAQSAVRAGFEVIAADLFADADLRTVCDATRVRDYPDGLAEWLAAQSVDAWMFTGAIENHPELIDRMASIAPLWGVQGRSLRNARDPLCLQRLLANAGVAFPETQAARDASRVSGAWLAKSYRGASGSGVARLGSNEETPAGGYVQRFVPGRPMSVVYAVNARGARLLGVTEQLVGQPGVAEWGYCGSIGPIEPRPLMLETLQRLGGVLADDLELRGVVGVDLVVADDQVTVIEINPRYPASAEVLERATGRSVVAAHAAACGGESVDPWPLTTDRLDAKRIVYAPSGATATDAFIGWAETEQAAGRLADLPRGGDRFEPGSPVCTVLSSGAGEADAREAVDTAHDAAIDRLQHHNTRSETPACGSE
ncbi:MAG: ATP-grasp domain-containing protein [Planctomycetota bacterium]